jgi:hypothetical protein
VSIVQTLLIHSKNGADSVNFLGFSLVEDSMTPAETQPANDSEAIEITEEFKGTNYIKETDRIHSNNVLPSAVFMESNLGKDSTEFAETQILSLTHKMKVTEVPATNFMHSNTVIDSAIFLESNPGKDSMTPAETQAATLSEEMDVTDELKGTKYMRKTSFIHSNNVLASGIVLESGLGQDSMTTAETQAAKLSEEIDVTDELKGTKYMMKTSFIHSNNVLASGIVLESNLGKDSMPPAETQALSFSPKIKATEFPDVDPDETRFVETKVTLGSDTFPTTLCGVSEITEMPSREWSKSNGIRTTASLLAVSSRTQSLIVQRTSPNDSAMTGSTNYSLIGGIIGGVVGVLIIVGIALVLLRKRKGEYETEEEENLELTGETFGEPACLTQMGFSEEPGQRLSHVHEDNAEDPNEA